MITNLLPYPVLRVTVIGALSGLVEAFVYLDRHILFAESIIHGTFSDAVLGAVITAAHGLGRSGMSTSLFANAFLGTIPLVALMRWLMRTPGVSSQSAAGIMPTAGSVSGYFLVTWFKPLPFAINSFLIGSVMTVSPADVAWADATLLVALVVAALGGCHLVAHCFDPASPAAAAQAGRHGLVILGLALASATVAIFAVSTTLSIALIVAPATILAPLVHSSRALLVGTSLLGAFPGIADLAIVIPARLNIGGTIALLYATYVLASRLPYWLVGPGRRRRTRASGE